MADKEEIILMTKLALHEKKYGRDDKKRNSYFKWDYIYINNWYTRVAVGIAALIVISWLIFKDIYMKEIIPILEIELGEYLYQYLLIFIVLIVAYSFLSTAVYNKKYDEMKNRLDEYQRMLKQLDDYQNLKQIRGESFNDTI